MNSPHLRRASLSTITLVPGLCIAAATVRGQTSVDYQALERNRDAQDSVVAAIGDYPHDRFTALDTNSPIAFLINADNALALRIVIDHYLRPSIFCTLTHPNFGIRQIPGAFDNIEHKVMGKPMTLDDIEHETLRTDYNEPRIHMALVCAAKSCPPLRREPYRGSRLDAQLDTQSRRFLSRPIGLQIGDCILGI